MRFLDDIRVIDLSTGISGPYATKLLADLGADVIKVEWPGGDADRHRSASQAQLGGSDSALFRFLHAGKRSVRRHEQVLRQLVSTADLLVTCEPADHELALALARSDPRLVVLAFSPWGLTGPWRDRPATEFIAQAEGGTVAFHGRRDQAPYQIGGRVIEWAAGVFGCAAALGAVRRAKRTGHGEIVDSSLQAAATFTSTSFVDARFLINGQPELDPVARIVEAPSIEPTLDGWVGFNTNTPTQFSSFLAMIERPDLIDHDQWSDAIYRMAHLAEFNDIVHEWTRARTTAEIIELASLFRIPVAPVSDAPALLTNEHFAARGIFVPSADGTFMQPASPVKFDGERLATGGPAPTLGEHDTQIEARERIGPATPQGPRARPLEGMAVLDCTAFWAGPSVGQFFAFLGAEVIHLESVQRPDFSRLLLSSDPDAPSWWEKAAMWQSTNRDKASVTLDLSRPEGRELVLRLVESVDVVIENFSPRVFDNFGLTADAIRTANPRAVFARMPAFGLSGPWRENVGFAQTMEQATGMAWTTGHRDDQPRIPRGPCDPLAGYHAAVAVLAALEQRERTGVGCHIELTMVEAALNAAAELVVEYTAYGAQLSRDGNRSPDAAPQGLYAAPGVENWLAISIASDTQWAALCRVVERSDWATDPELATMTGRRRRHDELDAGLAGWASQREVDQAVSVLVAAGVPAGVAADPRRMSEHPQLSAYGYYESTPHPITGNLALPSIPVRYHSIEQWSRTSSPLLGSDNERVLGGRLGLGPDELAQLAETELIGDVPLGYGTKRADR